MSESLRSAWAQLGGISQFWAMEPRALEALAVTVARGERQSAVNRRTRSPLTVGIVQIVGPLFRRKSWFTEFLGLQTYDAISASLAEALNDSAVERILLATDSPGGDASGLPELQNEIVKASRIKPVTAFVDGLAGSAALWLISGSQHITATKSSSIGSVGVWSLHVDRSGEYSAAGLRPEFLVSKISPYKVETNDTAPLSDEARAYELGQVDYVADQFVSALAAGRNVTKEHVIAKFGRGRMMFAPAAASKSVRMIDAIGNFDAAIQRAASHPKQSAAADRRELLASFSGDDATRTRKRRLEMLRHG